MPYLFVFDMDKTILPELRTIAPGLREAVAHAYAAGHRCMLATARPLPCVKWVWEALGLDTPMCLANGVELIHPADPSFVPEVHPMPEAQVRDALDYAFSTFPDAHIYLEYGCRFWSTRAPKPTAYFGMVAEACETARITADGPRPATPGARIGFYLKTPEQMEVLADHFAADPTLTVLRQPKHGGEARCVIYPATADKWYAVARAAARMGYRREEIIAFGDNWNDVMMLREAGRGYAMRGGAILADYDMPNVTRLSCAEGGVADTIESILAEKSVMICS